MLEEALRDPAKNPAEVAAAMLSFIRSDLPNGGSSAEERFFNLFALLCTRVYGPMQDSKSQFRHEAGGWLSATIRWKIPQQGSQGQRVGQRTVAVNRPPSYDQDPVVQLLGPMLKAPNSTGNTDNDIYFRSLIETISQEGESRHSGFYPFPFLALPEALQQQFVCLLQLGLPMDHQGIHQQVTMSHNSFRLFGSLLRVPPEAQSQVVAYQQKKLQARHQAQPMLQLSPGLSSPQPIGLSSPQSIGSPSPSPAAQIQQEEVPNLFLNMLENFMFLFIRYPLSAAPTNRQPPSHQSSISMRGTIQRTPESPYGERVYQVLFNRYLRHFLAHMNSPTYQPEYTPDRAKSEFFLRTVIAFWFEAHGSILTTAKATQAIFERFHRTGIQQVPSADLNMSYDLTRGKFDPPPILSQKCIRSLITHIITDPTIHLSVMDPQSGGGKWCLSQATTTLQQPLYNYIRGAFRHASIHSAGSVFYSAMNAWLMWLEPWNVTHASKAQNARDRLMGIAGSTTQRVSSPSLSIPPADRKSTYTNAWKPYIASNLFLYTVPLAIFLRRARELDFSQRELVRSRNIVKRVFRVYTPEVIAALNELTQFASISNGSAVAGLGQMVVNHRNNLGEFAPDPSGDMFLSSCQADMKGLLEEIQTQHLKTVRDLGSMGKVYAFLEGLVGQGVVSGEEIAFQSVVERAKIIVGLPIDYEVLPVDPDTMKPESGSRGSSSALRDSQGFLTAEGRKQLIAGKLVLHPSDVPIGDRMRGRPTSYEIPFLVPLTIALSDWLNKKWGIQIENEKAWRANLRFMADYRNLLFMFLCLFFTRVFTRILF